MSYKLHLAAIDELNPEALKADGFDEAIIGVGAVCGSKEILIYDANKCIDILMQRDEMSYEEATEFFDYNVRGAYMGEGTPMFAYTGSI